MHTIRVYARTGGLVANFRGLDAERLMANAGYFDGSFLILR